MGIFVHASFFLLTIVTKKILGQNNFCDKKIWVKRNLVQSSSEQNVARTNIPMAYVTDDPMNQVLKFGADLISKS